MIELKEFQRIAADQIAARFKRYYDDPPTRGSQKNPRVVPFYQSLASITASGKTVILADAVCSITAEVALSPVILWLSKGKVVVDQSYANLAAGGKYHHLLGNVQVAMLAEYDAQAVEESDRPLVYFATVGTFNQKEKEHGARLIFKSEIDTAESSIWDALKARTAVSGYRRPLIVVYDEGHNLTDQQMELLMELEPDALLAASATMKIPARLNEEIKQLKSEGLADEDLITEVDARAVAESGLIKDTVMIGGYEAPMEETLDALIADYRQTEADAGAYGVDPPKSIYVCKTNIVEGDGFKKDDPKQPFGQRKAPPILIWRYLVENCGVDPSEIAVYCSLKFDKNFPPPDEFVHFKGAEKDYTEFIAGDYRHVIFNLTLQEGWDDPLCYFAYIDKSMGSNVQVEQIIGRVLRQPGGEHYGSDRLNTANFYIRVDRRGTFSELLKQVEMKLQSEAPEIKIVDTSKGKSKPVELKPLGVREVFTTAYISTEAVKPIEKLVENLPDFRDDNGTNTKSQGGRLKVQRKIGVDNGGEFEWEEFEHTNHVSARWLFQREILRQLQAALAVTPSDAAKFDAEIGFGSKAHAQITSLAREVVRTYLDNVYLKQKSRDPYTVGPVMVRLDAMAEYKNALHDGYSDMNSPEQAFAAAVDATGIPWCRNPPRTGYGIPLVTLGPTQNFYPDFLVWKDEDVFAIDTTGAHLLAEKTGRKLLNIMPPRNVKGRLVVRFIAEGKWQLSDGLVRDTKDGYTVFSQRPDRNLRTSPAEDMDEAVTIALSDFS